VIGKSCEREMAAPRSLPKFRAMKTKTRLKVPDEIGSYAELQRQIHDALRAEHPEWVQPNGDCPTCESYESRLAELLGKLTASPTVSSPTEEHWAIRLM